MLLDHLDAKRSAAAFRSRQLGIKLEDHVPYVLAEGTWPRNLAKVLGKVLASKVLATISQSTRHLQWSTMHDWAAD